MPVNRKVLHRDSGFVLVVSLFILSFLSVVAITLAHYGHLAMKLTSPYKQQYRSSFLAYQRRAFMESPSNYWGGRVICQEGADYNQVLI